MIEIGEKTEVLKADVLNAYINYGDNTVTYQMGYFYDAGTKIYVHRFGYVKEGVVIDLEGDLIIATGLNPIP